jgi:hypothetical protein
MTSATPTALPSAEDAEVARIAKAVDGLLHLESKMSRAIANSRPYPVSIAIGDDDIQRLLSAAVQLERCRAALQSPRASDEVLGEAGDDWLVRQLEAWPTRVDPEKTTNIEYLMKAAAKRLSASPVPVDASGDNLSEEIDRLREALAFVCFQAQFLTDTPVGQIVRQSAQKALETDARHLSHTAPVADAQAGEGK